MPSGENLKTRNSNKHHSTGNANALHAFCFAKIIFRVNKTTNANIIGNKTVKNIASGMYCAYAEFGFDWLYKKQKQAQLITFVRGEILDLNSSTPAPPKAIYDGTEKQTHIIAGISYLPIPNVVVKADVRLLHTGAQNPDLVINPAPNAIPYQQNNQFFNIGIGYSF